MIREDRELGIIRRIAAWGLGKTRKADSRPAVPADPAVRRCHFEIMEPRRVLSANPVVIGASYHEGDGGQDTIPDYFQVTFQGGSATTQLNSFTISGDKDGSGTATRGDMIFDTSPGGPGVDGFHAFQFDAARSIGVTAADISGLRVSENGLSLTVDIANFTAGDKLAFTLDVDEIEHFSLDPIASGVEFEGSRLSAVFHDPHYTFADRNVSVDVQRQSGIQTQSSGIFYDYYDSLVAEGSRLAGDQVALRADNDLGQQNRSAATVDVYDLIARPVTISGQVYHDENLNCERDSGESGIGGVKLTLQRINDAGSYQNVATTTTNASGIYEFGLNLNLQPGTYRVVETQPSGFLDVAASAGSVAGSPSGTVLDDANGDQNVIANIHIPLGGTAATDYDFKEVRPAAISGHVWHDRNDNGRRDSGEEGIASVLIQVTRLGAKDASIADPFAGTSPIFVRTTADGSWTVEALPPGRYEVVEINSYPGQPNPLAGFLDGRDSVGTIGGTAVGVKANDRFNAVTLCAGDRGINYDFGELKPNAISGFVSLTTPEGDCIDPSSPDFRGIAGVTIQLLDSSGALVGTTQTNAGGFYQFTGLRAGTYTVVEVQPSGFLDGGETVGKVDGAVTGQLSGNDRFANIKLVSDQTGTRYDFCEMEPASITGRVFGDADGNCIFEPGQGDRPLAGVTLILTDASGREVARTLTDANGDYRFDSLAKGTYTVRQIQPAGYLDGGAMAGKTGSQTNGIAGTDSISRIVLRAGDAGTRYDFCEYIPAEICGTVYHDRNNNGSQDAGEEGIGGTRILLTNASGVTIAEQTTNSSGQYCFRDLIPGEYCVREIQPSGYIDGRDTVGTIHGIPVGTGRNDELCAITLRGGEKGLEYNFGERRLASISGYTLQDSNGDCRFTANSGDSPLAGVTVQLLDSQGNLIATTQTGADGSYRFDDLTPGNYSVRQIQPGRFFTAGQRTGFDHDGSEGSGNDSRENLIADIAIGSGQQLQQYNFCEEIPAELKGRVWEDGPAFSTSSGQLPEGYRSQRDGIFQAGVDTPISGVMMRLYWYIDPLSSEIAPRAVRLSEVMADGYAHVGTDPDAGVWLRTDANGEYHFTGLRAGNYIVVQEQPVGYSDANDVVGSTTGVAYNSIDSAGSAPLFLLSTFSTTQLMDSVVNIQVAGGGISVQNNFTEVRAVTSTTPPRQFVPEPPTPPRYGNPQTPWAPAGGLPGLSGSTPGSYTRMVGTSGFVFQVAGQDPYTWHLSVINAGMPRAIGEAGDQAPQMLQAAWINASDWDRFDMDLGEWSFAAAKDGQIVKLGQSAEIGLPEGIPLAGDFDGDGVDEVAIYHEGYWMIDINRSGTWDREDLLARLGDRNDSPVVGDWDGDGKDDIGIYGPIWERDPEAIASEPGLPNPENRPLTKPKNVPPLAADSTNGARFMKLTAYGKQRADIVDHVFGIDEYRNIPVTGDWNGTGIRSIGTFNNGQWRLDVDGNGRFDQNDTYASFGQTGDIPLVGDFNGDGIGEIAVFRAGTWIIDMDRDYSASTGDVRIEYGLAGDQPVVGDWDGDGIDDIATYRAGIRQTTN